MRGVPAPARRVRQQQVAYRQRRRARRARTRRQRLRRESVGFELRRRGRRQVQVGARAVRGLPRRLALEEPGRCRAVRRGGRVRAGRRRHVQGEDTRGRAAPVRHVPSQRGGPQPRERARRVIEHRRGGAVAAQ